MMKEFEGTIKNKNASEWNKIMLYSFQLEGLNLWFRTGQTEIDIPTGTYVKFMANETNKQVDLATLKVWKPDSSTAGQPKSSSTSGPSTTREDYWTNRERLDSVRNARSDATRIVCAALAHNHLPHSDSTAKGKRLDLLVGYIKEVAEELLTYEKDKIAGRDSAGQSGEQG